MKGCGFATETLSVMFTKSMQNYLDQFLQSSLPRCLITYQFIEEALRTCLINQHAIVYKKLNGALHYNPPIGSIENAALGKLIEYFKVFSKDNCALVKKLNQVKGHRDNLAHRGYVMYSHEISEEEAREKLKDCEEKLEYAKTCLNEIHSLGADLELQANTLYDKPKI